MKQTLVIAAAVVLAVLAMVGLLQRLVLFPRHLVRAQPHPGRGVPGLERLGLQTPDGNVEAYFLPGDGIDAASPGPAVVFAHGNGELIEHWPELLAPYRRMGVSILLPEYRGYGRSAGSPSQAAIVDDFERLYDLLASRPEVDQARIVFHGRSLGGGVVCALAVRRPPAALILTSTFTSIRAMARRYLMPGSLVRDPFDSLSVVRRLDVPVLVGHGDRDRIVPISHGRQLHAAAANAKLLVEAGSGHDYPRDSQGFFRQVEVFLRTAGVLDCTVCGGMPHPPASK